MNKPITTRANGPRKEMECLPWYLQGFLSWLTGKPSSEEWINMKLPSKSLYGGLSLLLVMLVGSEVILASSWNVSILLFTILLPLMWLIIVYASRSLQVAYCHHLSHAVIENNTLPEERRRSKHQIKWLSLLGELVTIFLILPSFRSYAKDHHNHHHGADKEYTDACQHGEPSDPDLNFLYELGFRTGIPRTDLWKRLKSMIYSPFFHYLFLKKRIVGRFAPSLGWRSLLAVIIWGIVLCFLIWTNSLALFVIIWVIPVIILYQISALLQFTCEHSWVYQGQAQSAERYTFGRFCGESPPPNNSPVRTWTKWWIRMLLIHLPSRAFVLVEDLPNHDWHHKEPFVDAIQWRNSGIVREIYIEETGAELSEVWGLYNCIDHVFIEMSQQ